MAASPVIAQWLAAKEQQPDALLFFRMGDFYELFFDDAALAASALGIALTARGEHEGKPIAMCGVPIHAADGYLARLIRRGFRVAVAEQMEAASARVGKAPLKREIVRLVTPGTLTEDSLLEGARANLLLAVARAGRAMGAAWVDISTGLFETQAVDDLVALLGRLDPAEILAPADLALGDYEARRAPGNAAASALGSAGEGCGGVRGRHPGRVRRLHRCGSDGRRAGAELRHRDPGRADARIVAPRAQRRRWHPGDGCGHPRQPGDHPRAGRQCRPHPAGRGRPHPDGAGGADACGLVVRPAYRPGGNRGPAGGLGRFAGPPARAWRAASGATWRAGRHPRARTLVARPRRPARPAGDPPGDRRGSGGSLRAAGARRGCAAGRRGGPAGCAGERPRPRPHVGAAAGRGADRGPHRPAWTMATRLPKVSMASWMRNGACGTTAAGSSRGCNWTTPSATAWRR